MLDPLPYMTDIGKPSKFPQSLIDRLHELLYYDMETGYVMWRDVPAVPLKVRGKRAGCVSEHSNFNHKSKRYCRKIKIDGRAYKEHHIVFMLVRGYCPSLVDHDDRNPLNNDIGNLNDGDNSAGAGSAHSFNGFNSTLPARGLPRGVYATRPNKKGVVRYSARVADPTLGSRPHPVRNADGSVTVTTCSRLRSLGTFDTPEEAEAAVIAHLYRIRASHHVTQIYEA